MKKRAWKRAVSAVLAAGMVLTCTVASALAAEPDSVQEFRQGKTKMISAVDGGLLVLQEDGTLWGWGNAKNGQLGNGGSYDDAYGNRTYPEKLMTDVAYVKGGGYYDTTFVIKNDGTLWYSGDIARVDTHGMMVKERVYRTTFQKLTDHAVAATEKNDGDEYSFYVVKDNGELWKYQKNEVWDYGEDIIDQNGNAIDGSFHYEFEPIKFMDDVEKVAACSLDSHALAMKKDGSVWAWGGNGQGQIGNGTQGSDVEKPVKVLENAKDIAVGYIYAGSAAIKTDGSLWVWGYRPDEQMEGMIAGFSTKPVKILDSVKDISIQEGTFAVLLQDDTIGEFWDAKFTDAVNNAFVSNSDSPVKDIEASTTVLFVLKEDGSLWATGRNQLSLLGLESAKLEENMFEDLATPVQLTGMEKAETPVQTAPQTATPTTSKVMVNGKAVSFDAYKINGNNYFKLRDIAKVLSGTDKQFEVTWDSAKNAINLISGQPYTPVGGELATGSGANQQAVLNTSTVYLNGKQIALTAYTIKGNNYFKLRDLGQSFDFGVGWDGANNTVTIDTNTGYTPE